MLDYILFHIIAFLFVTNKHAKGIDKSLFGIIKYQEKIPTC